jgi:hypothetical protein
VFVPRLRSHSMHYAGGRQGAQKHWIGGNR